MLFVMAKVDAFLFIFLLLTGTSSSRGDNSTLTPKTNSTWDPEPRAAVDQLTNAPHAFQHGARPPDQVNADHTIQVGLSTSNPTAIQPTHHSDPQQNQAPDVQPKEPHTSSKKSPISPSKLTSLILSSAPPGATNNTSTIPPSNVASPESSEEAPLGPTPPPNSDWHLWYEARYKPDPDENQAFLSSSAQISLFGVEFPVCLAASCKERCFWSRSSSGAYDCSCDLDCYRAGDCCLDFEFECHKEFKSELFDYVEEVYNHSPDVGLVELIENRVKLLFPSEERIEIGDIAYTDDRRAYDVWSLDQPEYPDIQTLVVDNCPENDPLYQKCHQPEEFLFPLLIPYNGIRRIYKNKYCALCAKAENQKGILIWGPYFECSAMHVQNAYLIRGTSSTENLIKYLVKNCLYDYDIHAHPSIARSLVLNKFINTCDPKMGDYEGKSFIQKACHSYQGPVQVDNGEKIFANAFCAYCNGIKSSELRSSSCAPHEPYYDYSISRVPDVPKKTIAFRFPIYPSFFHMFENSLDPLAASIGEELLCPPGKLYDLERYMCVRFDNVPVTKLPSDRNYLKVNETVTGLLTCFAVTKMPPDIELFNNNVSNFIRYIYGGWMPSGDEKDVLVLHPGSRKNNFFHTTLLNKTIPSISLQDLERTWCVAVQYNYGPAFQSISDYLYNPASSLMDDIVREWPFDTEIEQLTVTHINTIFPSSETYLWRKSDCQVESFDVDQIKFIYPYRLKETYSVPQSKLVFYVGGRFYSFNQMWLGRVYEWRNSTSNISDMDARFLACIDERTKSKSLTIDGETDVEAVVGRAAVKNRVSSVEHIIPSLTYILLGLVCCLWE